MEYLNAFLCGGVLCAVGQVLIDRTRLTPARILTGYVVIGWSAIGFVASACYRFKYSGKILLVHFVLTLLRCCWNCIVIYG